ncbi:MAG: ATP-dependent Clp protease adapter ClpS [Euzebyales bacterium]|jgi:ATP-dependent Clp protease adaptor protein ClpS|nr:ATP-dependent Clp protease adapter ClpS [Euzebyales bacterium]
MTAAAPVITPERVTEYDVDARAKRDRPWNVIVWNDPVTLMSYVVFVLRKLFGHDEATATKLMLRVHQEGRAVVSSGPREKAESDVHRLHAHGLQATMARD